MTVKGTQRIGGATVTDPDRFFAQIILAAGYAKDPEVARGQLIHMVVSAIKEAKKPGSGGYGSCSTCDVLAVVNLDEVRRRLICAEFYVVKGEYQDEEAFR